MNSPVTLTAAELAHLIERGLVHVPSAKSAMDHRPLAIRRAQHRDVVRRSRARRYARGLNALGRPLKRRPNKKMFREYTCTVCGSPGWTRSPSNICLGCQRGDPLSKKLALRASVPLWFSLVAAPVWAFVYFVYFVVS